MTFIPKQVKEKLKNDEIIEKIFKLRKRFSPLSCSVYASNSRLIIQKYGNVIGIPYESIESADIKHKRRTHLIILGIIHSIAGALIYWTKGEGYSILMIPAGFLIIYSGYSQNKSIELNISGRLKPMEIKGQAQNLSSLMDIIRDKTDSE